MERVIPLPPAVESVDAYAVPTPAGVSMMNVTSASVGVAAVVAVTDIEIFATSPIE